MASIYVPFPMRSCTNIFNDGQERGTSCEFDLTRVRVYSRLTAESACVDVQGSASNEHGPNVDI